MIVLQLRHGFGTDLWAAIMELGVLPSANMAASGQYQGHNITGSH